MQNNHGHDGSNNPHGNDQHGHDLSKDPSQADEVFPCPAASPLEFNWRQWARIAKATFDEIEEDNLIIVSAGVAFFTMLAIFPLITACISLYGYLADPQVVVDQLAAISDLMPEDAWGLLNDQVLAVVNTPQSGLGLRIAIGLLIAFWSAGAGIRAIMQALNIAYGEREERPAAARYALAGALTLSVTIFMWISLAVIIGVPSLLSLLKLEGMNALITRCLPWVLLIGLFSVATIVLYRVGPSRRPAKLRWVIPGTLLATLGWFLTSFGFSKFVSQFGTYNAAYGSLSAVIILLIWFWLTAFIILVGAELNGELERHTAIDTTRGPDRPCGNRGAAMADYVW